DSAHRRTQVGLPGCPTSSHSADVTRLPGGLTLSQQASPRPARNDERGRDPAARSGTRTNGIQGVPMRGNVRFARLAGVIALGGAFYTATYITSSRGGAPTYAFLGLLAGTAGGIVALAWPRSSTILTLAAVLLGFAFTGAFIESGIGFLPGFVLMIMAA